MTGPTFTIPAATPAVAATTATEDSLFGTDYLRAAVMLSLFCDRRAEDDDALPADDGDKRGWWGDEFAEVAGDKIGSRRWLLDRAKNESGVAGLLETYDREALAWMIKDKVAIKIDVKVTATRDRLAEEITIQRPGPGDPTRYKFASAWDAVGGWSFEVLG